MDPPARVVFNWGNAVAVLKKDTLTKVDADMAAVIMTGGITRVNWPLKEIDQALDVLYQRYALPYIYAARNDSGYVVGYLVMEYREDIRQDQINSIFNRILTEMTSESAVQTPYFCQGLAYGETVGVVAHNWRFGPELPLRAINYAIETIYLRVAGWPQEQLYLYGAGRGESEEFLSGVLVAQNLPDYSSTDDDQYVGEMLERFKFAGESFPPEFRPDVFH